MTVNTNTTTDLDDLNDICAQAIMDSADVTFVIGHCPTDDTEDADRPDRAG
jgi:hypothetical protein